MPSPSSYLFINQHRTNVNALNYYYYSNAFTIDEIERIKRIGESIPKQKAVVGGEQNGTVDSNTYTGRQSVVSWIDETQDSSWLYEKIGNYAITANKELWNFDIWGYQDPLQYTTYYGNGGHYDWHVDLGPEMSNRKLSVVLQLADPNNYAGGDLEINCGGFPYTVPRQLGLLCFFPSFLLHRVTPVTSGTRISLVTWLCGANFR
jgi:PKHD-type hydroxylase